MLRRMIPLVLAGFAGVLFGAAALDPDKDKPRQKPEWMAMGEPNSKHAKLAMLAGDWDQTIRMYTDPKAPPAEAKGTAKYRVILGGRFVTEEVKWTLGETPFEWSGMYGYDNRKKKYIAIWADNLDTAFEQAEGGNDNGDETISFTGIHVEPSTGEDKKFRWTLKLESQNRVVIEMFELADNGTETKTVEIEQKRK